MRTIDKIMFVSRSVVLFVFWAMAGPNYAVWSYHYYFEPIVPSFDSIAARLDSLDQQHQLGEAQARSIFLLDSICAQHPDRRMQARFLYWEVKCHQFTMESDSSITKLERALSLAGDTGYDRLRIAYQLAGNYQRTNRLTEAWQLLTDVVIPGLEQVGDNIMLGNAYHLYASQRKAAEGIGSIHFPVYMHYRLTAVRLAARRLQWQWQQRGTEMNGIIVGAFHSNLDSRTEGDGEQRSADGHLGVSHLATGNESRHGEL